MGSTEHRGGGELTAGRFFSCDPPLLVESLGHIQLMLLFCLVLTQILTQTFITLQICVAYDNLMCILVTAVVC